ncbi:MAG TPA: UDP-glucose/GDP-mannose dehydrogenase family protein [Candidatus Tyrphobacter sp.]
MGAGYVGLVTAACLAELGNRITCIDVDPRKVAALQNGTIPFYEPGLRELVLRNQQRRRLDFSSTVAEATVGCEYVFIAVGTPANPDGSCDLSAVHLAARQIGEARLAAAAVVVNKSTVPVGTGDVVARIIQEAGVERNPAMVVSNPEFLREGSAVSDFLQPDRVIIGAGSADAALLMRELYAPLNAPIIVTDVRTAEMIKYAANAFLATKISFINEIADLCEELGADVTGVIAGAGADSRIGMASFNAGLGFGGSCFPKDVSSLMDVAKRSNVPMQLLPAVLQVNRRRVDRVLGNLSAAIGSVAGKRVAVFGLAFKANTDDVRESPALTLIERLLQRGATVAAHDPIAIPGARRVLGDAVEFIDDCYRAANDADALLIATDWAEYRELDFATIKKLMRGSVVVDARNVCDPARVAAAGLQYIGVGHSSRATSLRARTVPPSDSIRTPFPLPAG